MPIGFGAPPHAPPLPEAAGGLFNECAGTINGTSTVTGTLTNIGTNEAAGTINGTSTVSGILKIIRDVAAQSDGTSTVTGHVDLIVELDGTSDGDSTVSGSLTLVIDVGGQSDGTSTVTGNLEQIHELTSAPVGTSTVSGNLFQINELTTQSDGLTTVNDAALLNLAVTARNASISAQVLYGNPNADARNASISAAVLYGSDVVSESQANSVWAQVLYTPGVHELNGRSDGTSTVIGINAHLLEGRSDGTSTVVGEVIDIGPKIVVTPGTDSLVVPAGVYFMDMKAWGAGGGGGGAGNNPAGDAGGGGFSSGTIATVPGETLTLYTGGGGDGGQGVGGTNFAGHGGAGGGYSAVTRGATRLIVAGGGGGGGAGSSQSSIGGFGGAGGFDTGRPGGDSATATVTGGAGGSNLAGGVAGLDHNLSVGDAESGFANQGGHGSGGGGSASGGTNGGGDGGSGGSFNNAGGGGGGGGLFGGGGGGGNRGAGGGGGGPNTITGITIADEQASKRIGAGKADPDYPGGAYGNGGLGMVSPSALLTGDDGEGGVLFIEWDITAPEFTSGGSNGTSTVQGTLDPLNSGRIPHPIPYDLSVQHDIHELTGVAAGVTNVIGQLDLLQEAAGTISGTSTVTGTLDNDIMVWGGRSDGTSTVLATLSVGSGGVFPNELEGRSDGTSSVFTSTLIVGNPAQPSMEQSRTLYQYINVGVNFEPTDDITTRVNGSIADAATVFAQPFPDGNTWEDFPRHLVQIMNIGVAFDDTDDITTRIVGDIGGGGYASGNITVVTQTFPDGHIEEDFKRYLYQYLHVIERPPNPGRLVLGPAPRRNTYHPKSKTPVSRAGGSGPEVV